MRYSPTNSNGEYTMTGVYLEVKPDLERMSAKLKEKHDVITVDMFTRVVNLYIQMMFKKIIFENFILPMSNKFGFLLVVQSLCIRYNPTKAFFTTTNGHVERHVQKIKLVNGRWAYMFWDTGKTWRMFRFVPAPKFKRMIAEQFFEGKDYPEMDLKKYGRLASPTYIQIHK